MAWYWVVLIFIGYCLFAGITYGIIAYSYDDDGIGFFGLMWPISLPCILMVIIGRIVRKILEDVRKNKHK